MKKLKFKTLDVLKRWIYGLWIKELFLIFIVLIVSVLCPIKEASSQVVISVQLPPPGMFNPEEILHMVSFNNPMSSDLLVQMTATVEEEFEGLIFSGTTNVFEIAPGMNTPHYSVYEPVEVAFLNKDYEYYVLQTNSVPSGNYIICIQLTQVTDMMEVGRMCVPHHVFHPSAPILVSPSDGSTVIDPLPNFIWLPPVPLPPIDVEYTLLLAEVFADQLPEEAIRANPPIFMESNIDNLNFQYPMTALPLREGQRYVWQVRATMQDGLPVGENEGWSDVVVFVYGDEKEDRVITPLSPIADCVGDVKATIDMSVVDFQFLASGNFTNFAVVVSNNPCGQFPKPGKPSIPPTPPPDRPTTPVTPGRPTKPVTPTTPVVPVNPPGDTVQDKPVVTPVKDKPVTVGGGETDTVSVGGETAVPSGIGNGQTNAEDWPDEGDVDLPALPPGWAWGPSGPYWTGEHPPEPPALPPGWAWGPLRPYWEGEGAEPADRTVAMVSDYTEAMVTPEDWNEPVHYQISLDLSDKFKPGQALVWQVYGIFLDDEGVENGYLSEPQCLRYVYDVNQSPSEVTPLACGPCQIAIKLDKNPEMNGGLDPPKEVVETYRDEFITLKAIGEDYDQIWWYCKPLPGCPESGSTDMRVTSSRVKFDWRITKGQGEFVELGCLPASKYSVGNRVIFKPPYVQFDSVLETIIKLRIMDDNPSQPEDKMIERQIIIKTERKRDKPDHYTVTIESDEYKMPQPSQITGLKRGTCVTRGPLWTRDKDLKTPRIYTPGVEDSKNLVFKERIRIYAEDIRDEDNVKVWCESSVCETGYLVRTYQDDVEYSWSIKSGGGKFIKGNTGRFVVYEASEEEEEVEIEVQVYNPSSFKIADSRPGKGSIKLKVHQPGVRMEMTYRQWVPEVNRLLSKKSTLYYKEFKKNEWKEGFNHQCRIHHIELKGISKEPGVCLNWPSKGLRPGHFVDTCPDLALESSDLLELLDTVKGKRWNYNDSTWFMRADSREPVKEVSFKVKSFDYGSYGFVRSVANGSLSSKTPYYSIPWKKSERSHGDPGMVTKNEYDDNRVSIPKDENENQIADVGWKPNSRTTPGGSRVLDPYNPLGDADHIPSTKVSGDGISNYEEYRGFWIKGSHQRLDPERKNLFLWDKNNLGIGSFGQSRVLTMRIEWYEMDTSRAINLNAKTHQLGFVQKGLRMVSWAGGPNATVGAAQAIGIPDCGWIWINSAFAGQVAVMNYTLAHEMSHGIGVYHHGEGIIRGWLLPGDRVKIDRVWHINSSTDTMWFNIACPGGLTSGDADCWMRYMWTTDYCYTTGPTVNMDCTTQNQKQNVVGWNLVTTPNNQIGTKITDIVSGTGVNAGSRCGKRAGTGRGKCKSQIKITCKP